MKVLKIKNIKNVMCSGKSIFCFFSIVVSLKKFFNREKKKKKKEKRERIDLFHKISDILSKSSYFLKAELFVENLKESPIIFVYIKHY